MRNHIRSIANPSNTYTSTTIPSSGGGFFSAKEEQDVNRTIEEFIRLHRVLFVEIYEPKRHFQIFSYYWVQAPEVIQREVEFKESKDFRWDYFWMTFLLVHKPYVFEKEPEYFIDHNISTVMYKLPDIDDFIIFISEEICRFLSYINHWKFLREELYMLLNFGIDSNPISSYVTHTCELSSVNNPNQKFQAQIDDENIAKSASIGGFADEYLRSKQQLTFSIPMSFE